ncbi:MAG: uracil-DNA glycosylase [Myxococcota bacterium]
MTQDPRDDMASALSLLADALRGQLEALAASGLPHIPRPRSLAGKGQETRGTAAAADISPSRQQETLEERPSISAPAQVTGTLRTAQTEPLTTTAKQPAPSTTTPSIPTTVGQGPPLHPEEDPVLVEIARSSADPQTKLERLRLDAIGDCHRCKLHRGRTQVVFGAGAAHARIVFVGEGPGSEEDRQGIPFVGPAGQLLTRMIEAMSLRRDEVYICNVVKCRPPNNRDPERDEVAACERFLKAQLDIIRPEVIVTLGRHATQTLLRSEVPISSLRGRWASYEDIPLLPTFHPAFLLRSPEKKREAWSDLQEVMRKLGLPA